MLYQPLQHGKIDREKGFLQNGEFDVADDGEGQQQGDAGDRRGDWSAGQQENATYQEGGENDAAEDFRTSAAAGLREHLGHDRGHANRSHDPGAQRNGEMGLQHLPITRAMSGEEPSANLTSSGNHMRPAVAVPLHLRRVGRGEWRDVH